MAAAVFLFLARVSLSPDAVSPPAFNWGLLTVMYADLGQDPEAVDALHKALTLSQQDAGFLAFDKGAQAERRLGNEAEAVRLYEMAIKLFPKQSGARYYYGLMKEDKGDLRGALSDYLKATKINPADMSANSGLARVNEKLGMVK